MNKEVRDANNIIHTATAVNEGPLFMVNLGRGLDKAEAGRMEKRLNSGPKAIEIIATVNATMRRWEEAVLTCNQR